MSKQSYFSHDSNARNDSKILNLRMKHGVEGYGVYFMLLERMRESEDYMSVKDYNALAFDFRVSSEVVKSVVEEFDLFLLTDDKKKFYSESFLDRMQLKDEKDQERSEKAKKAANARWSKEKS